MISRVVLVVDSDAFQRQLIDMLLAVDNYQIDYAAYGGEALEYLRHHTPDAVILAHNLPDISGADICSKVKSTQRLHDMPIILTCTPLDFETVKTLGRAVGANAVLAKPLGDKRLRERLADLMKPLRPNETADTALSSTSLDSDADDTDIIYNKTDISKSARAEMDLNLASTPEDQVLEDLLNGDFRPGEFKANDTDSDMGEPPIQDSVEPEAVEMTLRHKPEEIFAEADTPDTSIDEEHLLAELEPAETLPAADSRVRDPVTQAELVSLEMQVEDLGEENRLLRATVRELSQGKSLFSTDTYLDMIEELETLRRLTQRQTSQLETLQQQLFEVRSQMNKPEEARRNLSLWGRRRS